MNNTSTPATATFTLKEKISYTLLSVVVLGGSFFVGRSLIRKAQSTGEEKKSFEEGSPADYAKRIKMAFENNNAFGWGTDEEALRSTLRAIPSKEVFKQVIESYQRLYNRSLMADMKDELQNSEYAEMLAIITGKPVRWTPGQPSIMTSLQYQSWAKRLKAAFDITYFGLPGTDEKAIKAVFIEIPTQAAFRQVALAYRLMYGSELKSDLKGELEFWEYGPMMSIISQKPTT